MPVSSDTPDTVSAAGYGTGNRASLKLFCLPHAGGSAAAYSGWGRVLDPRIAVIPIELPGRGRRLREPLHTSATGLVDQLFSELQEELQAGPFAIFGHSMGGMLAFQLTHEILDRGLTPPVRLFLSAVRPPRSSSRTVLHMGSDSELLDALGRLNGAPKDVVADQELMKFMLPVVRADLQLAETWSFDPGDTLQIPVSLFGGLTDPIAPPFEIENWRPYFASEIERRTFQGDHFYLIQEAGELLDDLSTTLSRVVHST